MFILLICPSMDERYRIAKTFLKNNTKNVGSSNENKEHVAFSEPKHNDELSNETITSGAKRSRFFTDAQKIYTDVEH